MYNRDPAVIYRVLIENNEGLSTCSPLQEFNHNNNDNNNREYREQHTLYHENKDI